MKSVRLAITEAGLTEERIVKDTLGGAERFFIMWERYLKQVGYAVSRWPEPPNGEYDLCIHANFFDGRVTAKKHLVWGGGWEIREQTAKADKVVVLTHYMRQQLGWSEDYCEVFPAPFDHALLSARTRIFTPHRIVSNSNPSRFFPHMLAVANVLDRRGAEYDWHFCGGSKLYCPTFDEKFSFVNAHPRLFYRGILSRNAMIEMLNDGHVLAYPSFDSDMWETQGVAFLEAAALGLPVVLTKKQPFIEVMPEAFLCADAGEMADRIIELFAFQRIEYPWLKRYDSDVVFEQLNEVVRRMIGGPE